MAKRTLPTLQAVHDELKRTGTGKERLKQFADWIAKPVMWDRPAKSWTPIVKPVNAETLLCWAEDLHHLDPTAMGEGTVKKIGLMIVGDAYGIRQPGESNSDEIARLRERINELEQESATSSSMAGQRATATIGYQATIRTLQEENDSLKSQLTLLQRAAGPQEAGPISNPLQTPVPTRVKGRGRGRRNQQDGGTEEHVGQLTAAQ